MTDILELATFLTQKYAKSTTTFTKHFFGELCS